MSAVNNGIGVSIGMGDNASNHLHKANKNTKNIYERH